jgi:hypothetical protein
MMKLRLLKYGLRSMRNLSPFGNRQTNAVAKEQRLMPDNTGSSTPGSTVTSARRYVLAATRGATEVEI